MWLFKEYKLEWACVALGLVSQMPWLILLGIVPTDSPFIGSSAIGLYFTLSCAWIVAECLLFWKRGRRAMATLWVAPLVLGPLIVLGPLLGMCVFLNACL